jgi:hypothetical protein
MDVSGGFADAKAAMNAVGDTGGVRCLLFPFSEAVKLLPIGSMALGDMKMTV